MLTTQLVWTAVASLMTFIQFFGFAVELRINATIQNAPKHLKIRISDSSLWNIIELIEEFVDELFEFEFLGMSFIERMVLQTLLGLIIQAETKLFNTRTRFILREEKESLCWCCGTSGGGFDVGRWFLIVVVDHRVLFPNFYLFRIVAGVKLRDVQSGFFLPKTHFNGRNLFIRILVGETDPILIFL